MQVKETVIDGHVDKVIILHGTKPDHTGQVPIVAIECCSSGRAYKFMEHDELYDWANKQQSNLLVDFTKASAHLEAVPAYIQVKVPGQPKTRIYSQSIDRRLEALHHRINLSGVAL